MSDSVANCLVFLKQVIMRESNVAVSQFNKQDKYLNIKKDIIQNLSDEYYTRAICKCKYKDNWKGISAKFALKNKWVFLIYIYNKLIKG